MAVALDAGSESHTGTTGSASEASFSWTHTTTTNAQGILVFVINDSSASDIVGTVTIDGVNIPAVSGGFAADSAGEPRSCKAYYLGSGVPTTDNPTIVVNRTNNANVLYAGAITVTAAGPTEVYTAGIVLLEGDGTLAEQNVDDGSPGTNSLRAAGGSFALNAVPGGGANSTAFAAIDFGTTVAQMVRENAAGQGSRPIGFSSGTTDDRAVVHLAIREVITNVTHVTLTSTPTLPAAALAHSLTAQTLTATPSLPAATLRTTLTAVTLTTTPILPAAGLSGTGVYEEEVLADGPSAYWRLEETGGSTAADTAGTLDGTYGSGVTLADETFIGNTPRFTAAISGGVAVPHDAVLVPSTTAFTYEFWMRDASTSGNTHRVVEKDDARFRILFTQTQLTGIVFINGAQRSWAWTHSGALDTGQHHVVVRYDGATLDVFVDNDRKVNDAYAAGAGVVFNTSDLQIAGRAGGVGGAGDYFDGWIDEVAWYSNLALSDARIAVHFAAGGGDQSITAATLTTTPSLPQATTRTDLLAVTLTATPTLPAAGILSGYAHEVITDDPAGYWRLEEPSGTTAADSSGHGFDGSYVNTPTLGADGLITVGNAVTFAAASTEYVGITHNTALNPGTGDFSLETWFARSGDPAASQFLLNKGDATSSGYEIFISSSGAISTRIGAVTLAFDATAFLDGAARHLVITMDRDGFGRLYLDGVERATVDISSESGRNLNTTGALEIARRPIGNYFDGTLDEVAVYTSILSPERVEEHYAVGSDLQTLTAVTLTTTPTFPQASAQHALAHVTLTVTPVLPAAAVIAERTATHATLTITPTLPQASVQIAEIFAATLTITPTLPAANVAKLYIIRRVRLTSSVDTTTFTTDAGGDGDGTFTPAANVLLLAVVHCTGSAADTDPTSVTGNGATWSEVAQVSLPSIAGPIRLYAALSGGSPTDTAFSVTFAGSPTGANLSVYEVDGADVSGTAADALVQLPTNSGTGTSGSVTLAAAGSSDNRAFAVFGWVAAEGATAQTSWRELHDTNHSNPSRATEVQWRDDAFDTAAAATWIANTAWAGIAAEIKAAVVVQNVTAVTLTTSPSIPTASVEHRLTAATLTTTPLLPTGAISRDGLVGYGSGATGGAGGSILTVTNLNDSGAGSLRAALEASGTRIIQVDVSGTLTLSTTITVTDGNFTLETVNDSVLQIKASGSPGVPGGMQAPLLWIEETADNFIVRDMRFRRGATSVSPHGQGEDCVRIGTSDATGAPHDWVFDHCDFEWGVDECAETSAGRGTFQHCIFAEPLRNTGTHPDEPHPLNAILRVDAAEVTWYRNLFAHSYFRNPEINGESDHDLVNNLVYNYRDNGSRIRDAAASAVVKARLVRNYYKAGPDTTGSAYEIELNTAPGSGIEAFVEGNIGPHRTSPGDDEDLVVNPNSPSSRSHIVAAPTFDPPAVPELSAGDAYTAVLDDVGARPRDDITQRICDQVANTSGGIIDDPADVGGWDYLSDLLAVALTATPALPAATLRADVVAVTLTATPTLPQALLTVEMSVAHATLVTTPTFPQATVQLASVAAQVLTATPSLPGASIAAEGSVQAQTLYVGEAYGTYGEGYPGGGAVLPPATIALSQILAQTHTATPSLPQANVTAERTALHVTLTATPVLPAAALTVDVTLTAVTLTVVPTFPQASAQVASIFAQTLTATATAFPGEVQQAAPDEVLSQAIVTTPTFPPASLAYSLGAQTLTSTPDLPAASIAGTLTAGTLVLSPVLPAANLAQDAELEALTLLLSPALPVATVVLGALGAPPTRGPTSVRGNTGTSVQGQLTTTGVR